MNTITTIAKIKAPDMDRYPIDLLPRIDIDFGDIRTKLDEFKTEWLSPLEIVVEIEDIGVNIYGHPVRFKIKEREAQ